MMWPENHNRFLYLHQVYYKWGWYCEVGSGPIKYTYVSIKQYYTANGVILAYILNCQYKMPSQFYKS